MNLTHVEYIKAKWLHTRQTLPVVGACIASWVSWCWILWSPLVVRGLAKGRQRLAESLHIGKVEELCHLRQAEVVLALEKVQQDGQLRLIQLLCCSSQA